MPSGRTGKRRAGWPRVALMLWLVAAGCGDDDGGEGRGAPDAAATAGRDAAAPIDAAPFAERDAAEPGAAPDDDAAVPATAGRPVEDAGPADARTPPEPEGRRSLVAQDAWTPVGAADDPWDDGPADPACEPSGYGSEPFATETAYSIDTLRCEYLTVTQATLEEVRPGEELRVRVWHFELSGPEGAQAHVALTLDGEELLDERLEIPAAGGLLFARRVATETIPAGSPVYLHVHNHGANSYAFLELSTGSPD